MDSIAIIDRGRGPELAGTRTTVYDILPYLEAGDSATYIAAVFGLSTPQIEALIRYIEDHRAEVMAENEKIVARIARGNAPEIESRFTSSGLRARLEARREAIRQQGASQQEGCNGAGDPGRQ